MKAARLLVALSCGVLPLALAAPEPLPARAVEVSAAGWVRVALDAGALSLGGPAQRWSVHDPAGHAVPLALLAPVQGRVPLRTAAVEQVSGGWRIVFDAGPVPLRHDRLVVAPSRATSAEDCRVEAGDDLREWTLLGVGDVFRLGAADALSEATIRYPASAARYVRLWWPVGAGFPELSGAWVEAVPGDAAAPTTPLELSRIDDSTLLLRPAEAWLPLSRVVVRWRGEAPRSARLFVPQGGRWVPGAWISIEPGSAESRLALAERREPLHGALRLDVADASAVAAAEAELEPRWLLFEAPRAGRYLVAGAAGVEVRAADVSGVGPLIDVAPGGAASVPAALPRDLAEPRPREARASAPAWRVEGGAIETGQVARLELPGGAPADLAPVTAAGVLPHARLDLDPAPGQTLELQGMGLELPEGGGRVVQLELTAEARQAFQGGVTVRATRAGRPGTSAFAVAPRAGWSCSASEAPCRVLIDLALGADAGSLQLQLDGEIPRPLRARPWRARTELVFAWPGQEVQLAQGTGAPWAGNRDALLARPQHTVSAVAIAEPPGRATLRRIALIAALVVIGLLLLALLARSLRS
ncbi:MAG: hypothetical protein KBD01_15360 [Acidobacteria bacterium]|nr:hypothetical protein [Acidobacteriota bacterium]